jgi:hypothetical protein
MSTFRTIRPLIVDAFQCESTGTLTAHSTLGTVLKGQWVVKGENGESYVVDDSFFKRTFQALPGAPLNLESNEGRNYGC